VFDLDPGPGIEWPFVIDTALELAACSRKRASRPGPR
jgi:DNA primase